MEQVANILLIGLRREVGHEQRRPRSQLYINSVIVNRFLVSCLRYQGFIFRLEFNHGNFGILILPGEHLDTGDVAAL